MSSPCAVPVNFPATIENRPSLSRVQYRIGRYSDFRAAMLSALDRSPLLQDWTHRQPDDPGIAFLEGAAILGDILTFYQELYANEAWLRTATWPQSIASLVRLIGYRPAPGLGGEGYVGLEISGNSSVVVPAGFPFSAQIDGMSAPASFETSQSILAIPSLSRFSLYAPSQVRGVYAGTNQFGAAPQDLAVSGANLKAKDRLMLVDDGNSANRQIAVIQDIASVLDQTVIDIAGAWQGSDVPGTVTAYKLGRTFRAFGFNAPANQFTLDSSNTLQSTLVDTRLTVSSILQQFPLERQVNDLSAGITMLVDLQVTSIWGATSNLFESLTALAVSSSTDSVGPLQGGVTRVAFERPPSGGGPFYIVPQYTDRRTAICYEVVGQGFPLGPVRQLIPGTHTDQLDYLGDGLSYEALDGRLLQLVALNSDDTAARVEETTVSIDRTQIGDPATTALRRLSLAPALSEFTLADFPLSNSGIVVFGNVVHMTQGKTQPMATLGNGDARQIYQSFQLPKPQLTWLLNEALTPPREPEVTILVNQIKWSEVDSLFASGPGDQVYILREDNAGNTWVQFGDGIKGATLPSGIGNVTATYRSGNGANGWRQSGAKPQANGRIANLSQLRLYDEVTGGTLDENSSHIRQTAPGRVEELGRVVSLSDFEYEALAIPGVEKSLAIWDTEDNVPLLKLTVLLSDNTPAQLGSVQAAITKANSYRGANRFPVLVVDANLEYLYLAATIGLLPGYQGDPVLAAVANAIGALPADGSAAPSGGLFSVDQRALGREEYATRIEGALQNVEGVSWVEVTALGSLGIASDPSTLAVPAPLSLTPTISCADNRVLALYASHFTASIGDA
jgi:hypothetical protein